jgi:hypothetical protein
MSRAIHIDAIDADIIAKCKSLGVAISAIERLASGGTRVVLNSSIGAASIRKAYKESLLVGPVTRAPTGATRSQYAERNQHATRPMPEPARTAAPAERRPAGR